MVVVDGVVEEATGVEALEDTGDSVPVVVEVGEVVGLPVPVGVPTFAGDAPWWGC